MGSGYKQFTAGAVLTASEVNNYLMEQSVMTFAGSAARGSAIGTANYEEGMTSYLQDTDKLEVYNGTNWVSVAPTSTQGLTLINTTSFSAVASQSLPADTFTATYDNYLIQVLWKQNTTVGAPSWRFRSSGSDITTGYYAGSFGYKSNNTEAWLATSNGGTQSFLDGTNSKADGANNIFQLTLFSPLSASRKTYLQHGGHWSDADLWVYQAGSGFQTSASSCDSITILTSGGTFTGQIQTYGYND
jgi:hypothetical protein